MEVLVLGSGVCFFVDGVWLCFARLVLVVLRRFVAWRVLMMVMRMLLILWGSSLCASEVHVRV